MSDFAKDTNVPINDCISRQAAIGSAISGMTMTIGGEKWIRVSEVRESLYSVPSAQPETHDKHTETHECDYISRQEVVESFTQLWDCVGEIADRDEWEDVCRTTANGLPSAQQWIPVTERLPKEERKSYWVCTDTGYQCECRWTNNRFGMGEFDECGWSIFDMPRYSHVVAWMPLPEPWKGEEDETD